MDWDESAEWNKTEMMEGFSSYLKDFGLYSKSSENHWMVLHEKVTWSVFIWKTFDRISKECIRRGQD